MVYVSGILRQEISGGQHYGFQPDDRPERTAQIRGRPARRHTACTELFQHQELVNKHANEGHYGQPE